MEPLTHKTILLTLCYFELLVRLGFLEKDISFVHSGNESVTFTRIRLETQGKVLTLGTGRLKAGELGAFGGDISDFLGRAREHYMARDNSDGPLAECWASNDFERTKADYVRDRLHEEGIFLPPSTLKV